MFASIRDSFSAGRSDPPQTKPTPRPASGRHCSPWLIAEATADLPELHRALLQRLPSPGDGPGGDRPERGLADLAQAPELTRKPIDRKARSPRRRTGPTLHQIPRGESDPEPPPRAAWWIFTSLFPPRSQVNPLGEERGLADYHEEFRRTGPTSHSTAAWWIFTSAPSVPFGVLFRRPLPCVPLGGVHLSR